MLPYSLILAGAAALALTPPAQAQAGPPELDIQATCRSAGSSGVSTEVQSRDGCLRSEREARDEVKRRWGEFSTEAKTQCAKQSELGGSPGYVEFVTCLELASGSGPVRATPNQRTNPIEVLRKPEGQ
ncbi:hypothetical protein [Methylobacterium iners]|uniref:Lysozyme inhibitor LprI N-terminal domain-containing protein n=1 Tax=Methylobacterium iners TaxID=418707 RepID=A0ABQ4RSP8_9HYPH|nr:hypothetical protein [Methylobacterium iners]GJD93806.1 hypothetical protein OCOJLMKI_1004 [Methylobacterium iners]